jgi:hypothetical protein
MNMKEKLRGQQPLLANQEPNSVLQQCDTAEGNEKDKKSKSFSGYRGKRVRNLYDPLSTKPFKLSRSKLELFLRCPRCFYLDRRLGIGCPPGYPFSLNVAVDALLKKEFDRHREAQSMHPLCIENGIEAIPFKHDDIDKWRDSLHAGLQYVVPNTNLILQGGLDDVWQSPTTKELMIVDYKATSKTTEVSLDADWQIGYKRQAEVYQWLLRKELKDSFVISNAAYFVYCNGKTDADAFNKQLLFDVSVLPYEGDDSWVEGAIMQAYQCLQSNSTPAYSLNESCDYCTYLKAAHKHHC